MPTSTQTTTITPLTWEEYLAQLKAERLRLDLSKDELLLLMKRVTGATFTEGKTREETDKRLLGFLEYLKEQDDF